MKDNWMKYKDDSLVASFYDSQTTTFQEQGFETELAFELQVFVASLTWSRPFKSLYHTTSGIRNC